ncbi:MAG: sulfotransferase domain-containing protein [gamma proteobacterium symbiont of Bathyaustriella thionipta]|nr:sulfotransferase domain-containing protein [gamma proteobacterium symbiont of Bathyaustriella thionipta]MCU7957230.1 sulfotransferase domain-containing protein [gamma proteobacterium symbiont of Bathyaustriella thionipta]MCU7968049.1 sulfotransferase domain-containing protein [gamma proteobacterium symbiont of Bathyaustriella thionipta]
MIERGISMTEKIPALFHITHYKAGSQWIYMILQDIFPSNKIIKPEPLVAHVINADKLEEDFVYPTTYLDSDNFFNLELPENYKYFIVFRDLRDTLISMYFSVLKSHREDGMKEVALGRINLQEKSFDEGMLWLMEEMFPINAEIQKSWIEKGVDFIRYEDLLENDVEILTDTLINKLVLPIEKATIKRAVVRNCFRNLSQGRNTGEEDKSSHFRKGTKGDWENHFTDEIKVKFKELYGQILIDSKYEKDYSW